MSTYIFSDDVQTTLLTSISETATTISVANPTGVYNDPPAPASGQIATLKIVNRIENPSRREIIIYTGRTTISGGFTITGVVRGQHGSNAQPWESGCFVVGIINDISSSDNTIAAINHGNLSGSSALVVDRLAVDAEGRLVNTHAATAINGTVTISVVNLKANSHNIFNLWLVNPGLAAWVMPTIYWSLMDNTQTTDFQAFLDDWGMVLPATGVVVLRIESVDGVNLYGWVN